MKAAVPCVLERNPVGNAKFRMYPSRSARRTVSRSETATLSLLLAAGAKERRSLRLHNPLYRVSGTASLANFSCPVIYAMMILVAALLIQGVAIGAVAERRTLISDCRLENFLGRIRNRLPLG